MKASPPAVTHLPPALRKAGVLAVVAAAVRLLGALLPANWYEESGRLADYPLDLGTWTHVALIAWAGSRLLVNRWVGVASGALLFLGMATSLTLMGVFAESWLMFGGWEMPGTGLILETTGAAMMIAAGVIGFRHNPPAAARRVGPLPRVLILAGTVFWVAASVTPVSYHDVRHEGGPGTSTPTTFEAVLVSLEDLRRLLPGGEPDAPVEEVPSFESEIGEDEDPFPGGFLDLPVPLLADPLLWGLIYMLAIIAVLTMAGLRVRTRTGVFTGAIGAVGVIKVVAFLNVFVDLLVGVPDPYATVRLGPGLPLVLGAGVLLLAGALLRSRVLRDHATSQPTGDGDG